MSVQERVGVISSLDTPEWWPDSTPPMPGRELSGPHVWYGEDMAQTDEWIYALSDSELSEINEALNGVKNRADDLLAVDKKDFPLPTFGPVIENLRDEIMTGRGFALIRGLDMANYTKHEAAVLYWGIGRHFGEPRSQNGKGHVLGHVQDLGYDVANPTHRGYQTTIKLDHHTDSTDIAALMCLRAAKSGGESSLVSSTTVHNEMLRRCPELLDELFKPFYVDRREEIPEGKLPYYLMPIFNWHDGKLSAMYSSLQVKITSRHPGVPELTDKQKRALDMIHTLAEEPRIRLKTSLQPGDIQLVHNHTIFHAREDYEDWDDPEQKRHLLRLWLCPPAARELPIQFQGRYGDITVGNRGGIVVPGVPDRAPLDPE